MSGADAQPGRCGDAPRLHVVLPATAASVPTARHRLRAWLAGLDWPTEVAEDLEYVVSEAVTNVLDHAYRPTDTATTATATTKNTLPSPTATPTENIGETAAARSEIVEILAVLQLLDDGSRRVRVQVLDQGRWRPPRSDHGYRGRGLITMASMMDQISIEHATPDRPGTTITLLSRPIPRPAP